MAYTIVLRNRTSGSLEATALDFRNKKEAMQWKRDMEAIVPDTECRVYQRLSGWKIGKRID